MSYRMTRRMARHFLLQALYDVHYRFEEIADLMLLKFKDMYEAYEAS